MKDIEVAKVSIDDITTLISKWADDNEGNVCFFGSFVQFDPTKAELSANEHIPDDRLICYGDTETIEIMLEDFNERVKEEKDDFINW